MSSFRDFFEIFLAHFRTRAAGQRTVAGMGAPASLPFSRLAPVALIRAAGLAPVVAVLKRIGAPAERLLASANLPSVIPDDPEALISLCQAFRFMEEAARATGIENLGLLAGQGMQIDALGVFGRLIRRGRTLREAIETAIRTMPAFNSGGRYWLAHEGDRVRLCHEFVDGLDAGHRQADQYCLMLALNIVRLAAEPRWRRDDVLLETKRAGGFGDIEVLSDARIAFRQRETAVTFPQSLLSRPLTPGGVTRRIEDADIEAWWASGPAGDLPGSVMQVMATLPSSDYPRIGLTANAIGMSVRALQRRLAEAGVSHGRLVAESRFATAVRLLEGTDATVLDIALDLGYSDHAHFTRAFRRWTGIAPRDFRRVSRRMRGTSLPLSAERGSRPVGRNRRPSTPFLRGSREVTWTMRSR